MSGRTWAAAALLALLAAPPAGAEELPRWSQLRLSAAAAEPYANLKHAPDHPLGGVGVGEVELRGSWGCEATGAGYWTGAHEREPLIQQGAGSRRRHGLLPVPNPTAANEVRPRQPNREGFDWSDQSPAVPAAGPAGPAWSASCTEDGSSGRATGTYLAGPGPRALGSTVSAAVDGAGTYRGTARAYVQALGVSGGGALDSVTSFVQVTAPPDAAEPVVSYRLTLTGAWTGTAAARARYDSETVTPAGTDVGVDRFVEQFQGQLHAVADPLADLADFAVVVPPVVHHDRGRWLLTAPAVLVRSLPGGVLDPS